MDIKEMAVTTASKVGFVLKENAPQIVTGIGIVAGITSTVLAIKGTRKAMKVADRLADEYGVRGVPTYSGRSVPNQQPTGPRTLSKQEREEFNFSEYSFAERVDAERVMDMLQAQIDQEGNASVADFYGLIGVDTQYQDHKWGWTDNGELRNMTIRPNHGAYVIVMPQPVPLNVTGIRH